MASDLDQMLETIVRLPSPADVSAVYGSVATSGDRTIIPAAAVTFDFELAAERIEHELDASQEGAASADEGRARVRSRPVAVIELTDADTIVRPILDMGRVLPRLLVLAGWAAAWIALASALRIRRKR